MKKSWIKLVKQFEGLRLKPYSCPACKLTIGYGHNLEDNGISIEIAEALLSEDLSNACTEVSMKYPWIYKLDEARQFVLVDMCFNMGINRLSTFKKMLAAVKEGYFDRASAEMLDSKWAKQVGHRAIKLSEIMRTGEY